MHVIDLNCDIGESFGQYSLGNDEQIIPHVSSVNIACGFHAGDPATMNKTVKLAKAHQVRIGAHPGLPDLSGFGRREMKLSASEVYDLIVYQVGALYGFVEANDTTLHHVKPHGALYNMAAKNQELADAIAQAVYHINPNLTLFGLANSKLTNAASKIGLPVAHEVFADRTYQADGTLTPRTAPNAVITDEQLAIQQLDQLIKDHTVTSVDKKVIPIKADTVCVHGDNPSTLAFLIRLHDHFSKKGIKLINQDK